MTAVRIRNRRRAAVFPWVAAVAALVLAAPAGAAASFPFHVERNIPVAGTGAARALALAPDGSVVYLAMGHAITAYGARDGKPRATQSYGGEVTGLAASSDGHALYAVSRSPSRLLVLDPSTLKVERRKALPAPAPDRVFEGMDGHSIYVSGRTSHAIARYAAQTLRAEGSVRLEGAAGQVVDDGRGRLYVVVPGRAGVDVVDARAMRGLGNFATPGCTATGALALDPVGRRLFIGCASGEVAILDTDMGFVFRRVHLDTAAGARAVFAFHPAAGSGWKGGMFAIAGRHIEAVRMHAFVRYGYGGSIALPGTAQLIALSPDAKQLWTVVRFPREAGSADTDNAGQARILMLSGNGGHP